MLCTVQAAWSLCDYSLAAPVPDRCLRWRLWSQIWRLNSPPLQRFISTWQSFYLSLSVGPVILIISGRFSVQIFSACWFYLVVYCVFLFKRIKIEKILIFNSQQKGCVWTCTVLFIFLFFSFALSMCSLEVFRLPPPVQADKPGGCEETKLCRSEAGMLLSVFFCAWLETPAPCSPWVPGSAPIKNGLIKFFFFRFPVAPLVRDSAPACYVTAPAHQVWQEIVAALQYACLFSKRIIAGTHLLRRRQPAITTGRRHFVSHCSLCSRPVLLSSGIPGKKCGTIIFTAEELSNCRVGVDNKKFFTYTLMGLYCSSRRSSFTHMIYLTNRRMLCTDKSWHDQSAEAQQRFSM